MDWISSLIEHKPEPLMPDESVEQSTPAGGYSFLAREEQIRDTEASNNHLKKEEPAHVTGLPCAGCGNRKYIPAPRQFRFPDGENGDGWKCLGCGAVFLLTGNKQVDLGRR